MPNINLNQESATPGDDNLHQKRSIRTLLSESPQNQARLTQWYEDVNAISNLIKSILEKWDVTFYGYRNQIRLILVRESIYDNGGIAIQLEGSDCRPKQFIGPHGTFVRWEAESLEIGRQFWRPGEKTCKDILEKNGFKFIQLFGTPNRNGIYSIIQLPDGTPVPTAKLRRMGTLARYSQRTQADLYENAAKIIGTLSLK